MNTRISQLRKNQKLNQEDFANKIGLTKNFISLVETGNRILSDRSIKDICREFNVNEEWLRTGNGEMYVEMSKNEYIAEFVGRVMKDRDDSFKKRYIEMLSRLDERGWEALEQVALAMGQLKGD